jgi:hypothetical protein
MALLDPQAWVLDQRLLPTLTPAHIARIGAHGRRRAMHKDDVLVESGGRTVPFFVVPSGEIQGEQSADRRLPPAAAAVTRRFRQRRRSRPASAPTPNNRWALACRNASSPSWTRMPQVASRHFPEIPV